MATRQPAVHQTGRRYLWCRLRTRTEPAASSIPSMPPRAVWAHRSEGLAEAQHRAALVSETSECLARFRVRLSHLGWRVVRDRFGHDADSGVRDGHGGAVLSAMGVGSFRVVCAVFQARADSRAPWIRGLPAGGVGVGRLVRPTGSSRTLGPTGRGGGWALRAGMRRAGPSVGPTR